MTLAILDHLSALGDPTRSRILLALDRHELTVGELCQVLQLPQSTVSRHLRTLADERWVAARSEGTSRQYRLAALEPGARRLWHLVRDQLGPTDTAVQDRERLASILSERRDRSQAFFSGGAAQWDAIRTELFGDRAELIGLLGLLDESWSVGDLGCGTGQVAATLAPFVTRVVAIDASRQMLHAARRRIDALARDGRTAEVDLRHGELEALPLEDGELDAALLFLVLHYVVEPPLALAEAARVLRPGGRLVIMDLMPHSREDLQHQMGHIWSGFPADELTSWLNDAGFRDVRYRPLPPDPRARGPVLFCATARRHA